MKCHVCPFEHQCRTDLTVCPSTKLEQQELVDFYKQEGNQQVVQAAAELVDSGRAGTLSRMQEIIEYSHSMGYKRVGVAYCHGMEEDAAKVADLLRASGLRNSTVSCTTGALAQHEVNERSELAGVACNPAGQGAQLKAENVDMVVTLGLCLGHDMLLQRQLDVPVTTLVVKDRTNGHHPLQAVRDLHAQQFPIARPA